MTANRPVSSGRRVWIIGRGLVSSLGRDPAAFVDALGGADAPQRVDLDPAIFGGRNLRPLDRASQLAIAAAQLALDDAGLDPAETADLAGEEGDASTDGDDRAEEIGAAIGLVWGTTYGGLRTIVHFDRRALEAGPRYVKPLEFANTVINAPAGQTAIWHRLRGLNSTVAGGAAAGLEAITHATDLLRGQHAEILLAGGGEEVSDESIAAHEAALEAASKASPGMDGSPDRFRLGEAAGMLVLRATDLEDTGPEDAGPEGARAEIVGQGVAFDPSRGRDPESAALACERALRAALDEAGVEPQDMAACALSAGGRPALDAIEVQAIARIFGPTPPPAFAVKTSMGEALGGSGAVQTIALLEALARGEVPGTAPGPMPGTAPTARRLARQGGFGLVHAASHDGKSCALIVRVPESVAQEGDPA